MTAVLPERLWRAFPWEPGAAAGAQYGPAYVPGLQGAGRFDLRGSEVLYVAETPEHAVAEKLQRYRGQEIGSEDLEEFGRRLALVSLRLEAPVAARIADLCDPELLVRLVVRPDDVAARSRATTQRIAALLDEAGYCGLRWWSAFWGEWHTLVVFTARCGDAAPVFAEPEPLTLEHPAVIEAAAALGIRRAA